MEAGISKVNAKIAANTESTFDKMARKIGDRMRSIGREISSRVSARALMEDTGLLKKLEARARLQMNSVQAIGDALVAGLGCAIGTDLFMHECLQSGELISRPIIAPVLHRTLYLCQLTTRPPTVAREVIHDLIVQLVLEAVASGAWPARVLYEPPR